MNTDPVIDAERLRRIHWRARRGMLENDLLLSRFLADKGPSLTESQVLGLDQLLELTDNELLDLFLDREAHLNFELSEASSLMLDRIKNFSSPL
jgi:antitoxin CptB